MLLRDELEGSLKILSNLKLKAYEEGARCRILLPREIPENFRGGQYAELGMLSILGRISNFYLENYNVNFNIDISFEDDMCRNTDIVICGERIDFKSKYLTQNDVIYSDDEVVLIYDNPGFYNFLSLMKRISQIHYVPNSIIRDINYLWEGYMSFSTMKNNRRNYISYDNLLGDDLNNIEIYFRNNTYSKMYESILAEKNTLKAKIEIKRTKQQQQHLAEVCCTQEEVKNTNKRNTQDDEFVSTKDAAYALDIGVVDLYNLISTRRLNYSYASRKISIHVDDIESFICERISNENLVNDIQIQSNRCQQELQSSQATNENSIKDIQLISNNSKQSFQKSQVNITEKKRSKSSISYDSIDDMPTEIKVIDASRVLHRHMSTFYKLIKEGKLKSVKKPDSKTVYITKESLIKYFCRSK